MNQQCIPIQSYLRTAAGDHKSKNKDILIDTFDYNIVDLALPPGIVRIWKNPAIHQTNNLNRIRWLMYNIELVNKLEKCKIIFLNDILNNSYLKPYNDLKKWVTKASYGRLSLSITEYNALKYELCEDDRKLFPSIVKELNNLRNPINLQVSLVINGYICIFTDASENIDSTAYAIFAGKRNPFNYAINLPFSTNNRAELFAILHTIKRLPIGHKIKIFTDSKVAIIKINKAEVCNLYKKEETEIALEIQFWINDYKSQGGDITIEHIYSHLLDSTQISTQKNRKLLEVQFRYPNHWQEILEGNKQVDKMANRAKGSKPSFKHPPSKFGSNIILETTQGEIIQSGFKNKLKDRTQKYLNLQYNKTKTGQCLFQHLPDQKFSSQFDKKLMSTNDPKLAYLQDFIFKIKYNKLLTKINVISRSEKYKTSISIKYNSNTCPSCKNSPEDIFHFSSCEKYNCKWTPTKRRIISIINSFRIISQFDEWNKDWCPYSREIKFFPCWFDRESATQYYNNFNYKLGKIGILPTNLYMILLEYKINITKLYECSYLCYLEIWKTLRLCWIKRCKNFASQL